MVNKVLCVKRLWSGACVALRYVSLENGLNGLHHIRDTEKIYLGKRLSAKPEFDFGLRFGRKARKIHNAKRIQSRYGIYSLNYRSATSTVGHSTATQVAHLHSNAYT